MALVRAASPTRVGRIDLVKACIDGDLAATRRALSCGSDPNERRHGQTPLMFATENGHAAICELLLANGARVDAVDTYNRTALHFGVRNLHVDACKVLMNAGARHDVPSTLGGETAAHIVHMRGTIELVRAVMYHGSDSKAASPSKIEAPSRSVEAVAAPPGDEMAAVVAAATPEKQRSASSGTAVEPTSPPPHASNFPRKAPAPVQDETKRTHTPPRAQRSS